MNDMNSATGKLNEIFKSNFPVIDSLDNEYTVIDSDVLVKCFDFTSTSEDELCRISLKTLPGCPLPDSELVAWLVPGWDEYTKPINAYASLVVYCTEPISEKLVKQIEFFDNDLRRTKALKKWKLKRNEWVDNCKTLDNNNKVFNELLDVYKLQKINLFIDLKLGFGVITLDKLSDLKYPMITKEVGLVVDSSQSCIKVIDLNEPFKVEYSVFNKYFKKLEVLDEEIEYLIQSVNADTNGLSFSETNTLINDYVSEFFELDSSVHVDKSCCLFTVNKQPMLLKEMLEAALGVDLRIDDASMGSESIDANELHYDTESVDEAIEEELQIEIDDIDEGSTTGEEVSVDDESSNEIEDLINEEDDVVEDEIQIDYGRLTVNLDNDTFEFGQRTYQLEVDYSDDKYIRVGINNLDISVNEDFNNQSSVAESLDSKSKDISQVSSELGWDDYEFKPKNKIAYTYYDNSPFKDVSKHTEAPVKKYLSYDDAVIIDPSSLVSHMPVKVPDPMPSNLIDAIREAGIEYIDNRYKGGSLWIVGSIESLSDFVSACRKKGVRFYYSKSGGKATFSRSAWWTKAKGFRF